MELSINSITSMKRLRRTLTPEFKFQVVLEALQRKQSQSEVARQYDVHPQLIVQWKRQLLKQGPLIFQGRRRKDKQAKKIEELEKIIGQQTIEIQFLKKVLGHLG